VGILPGAGVQNNNQEPELSSKFRTGAGAVAISEVAWGPFRDANGFCQIDFRVLFIAHLTRLLRIGKPLLFLWFNNR